MMPNYKLSPLAIEDLRYAWQQHAKYWGLSYAEQYGEGLLTAFDFLVENPKRGIPIENIRSRYRKHSVGSHLIIYRIAPGYLEVMRILHHRMDV